MVRVACVSYTVEQPSKTGSAGICFSRAYLLASAHALGPQHVGVHMVEVCVVPGVLEAGVEGVDPPERGLGVRGEELSNTKAIMISLVCKRCRGSDQDQHSEQFPLSLVSFTLGLSNEATFIKTSYDLFYLQNSIHFG